LLRLVNAARLAPLEELLAGSRGNGSSGVTGTGGSGTGSKPAVSSTLNPSRATTASSFVASVSSGAFAPSPQQKTVPSVIASPTRVSSSAGGTATAAAPALSPTAGIAEPGQESGNGTRADGLGLAEVAQIKSAIQAQQKFIGEFLEYASRWELEGTELRICFPPDKSAFASLIEVRETMEKIRNVASNVLGRAVRVCARLDSSAASDRNSSRVAPQSEDLRARFEEDPLVKSMLQRFGGRISEVRRQED